jgi:hypothetical protein
VTRIPYFLMLAGVVLVLLSAAWTGVVSPTAFWSEEQAQQHAKAAADLHRLGHEAADAASPGLGHAGHQHPAREPFDPAALEAARQRFQDTSSQLESARSRQNGTATMLKWLGIITALAGVGFYYVLHGSEK